MKKNYFVVISTFIVVILSFILGINFLNSNKGEIKKDNNEEVMIVLQSKILEYDSSLKYDELIDMLFENNEEEKIKDIEVLIDGKKISDKDNIDFKTLGNVDIRVSYVNNGEKETKNVTWEVKDTKAPKISGVEDIEITLGEKLDYKENVKATDECDEDIELTFEGEVDEEKAGRYSVKVIATDKSGNVASEVFYITIKEKDKGTTSTTKTTKKITSTKKSSTSKTTKKTTEKTTKKTTTTVKNDASTKQGRLALAKAEAKKVIKNIIKPGMSDAQKAQAISSFLYYNVDKQMNQSTEAYKTNYGNEAYAALVMRIAACSGFCKAVTLLCDEAGLKSKHINANQWTHQWNIIYVDGKWQVLDAQLGYFGGERHPYIDWEVNE